MFSIVAAVKSHLASAAELFFSLRLQIALMRHFFNFQAGAPRREWPIWAIGAASVAGTLFLVSTRSPPMFLLERWSPGYLLVAPFMHAGVGHLLMNLLALHFVGGQMTLPMLGARRFLLLFFLAMFAGNIGNNFLGDAPAVGISAALMGVFSCALFRHGRAPMRLLLLHDVLRLRPFPLWKMAVFVVGLDIVGIVFGWQFFAHWAHLSGFATGLLFGRLHFPPVRR